MTGVFTCWQPKSRQLVVWKHVSEVFNGARLMFLKKWEIFQSTLSSDMQGLSQFFSAKTPDNETPQNKGQSATIFYSFIWLVSNKTPFSDSPGSSQRPSFAAPALFIQAWFTRSLRFIAANYFFSHKTLACNRMAIWSLKTHTVPDVLTRLMIARWYTSPACLYFLLINFRD